jgi:Asp-tRNA(Asn)/Glu-tRNA(Gln) amidotransferase A subunit family amidase
MISLLDIARRIDSGDLTPAAAIAAAREAIAAREGGVRAFVEIDDDAVATERGPLRGIAVGVKDIIDAAGLHTRMGSPIYADWRPMADAPVVAALRRAGATAIGKTTTTAFAFLDPTETRNPHNPDHTPGGSSAGSAAAVGAGMIPLALGTQTGGSIIRPASYCGAAAIKPSARLIPTVGVKCFSWTLDTVGLFAAGVADVAYALEAVTGRSGLRVDRREVGHLRIGVTRQEFAGAPTDEGEAALRRAIAACERAGAAVTDFDLPTECGDAFEIHGVIQDFEVAQALAWEYDHFSDALPPLLRGALDGAASVDAAAYDAARRTSRKARGAIRDVFSEVDVLMTLSAPGAAPWGHASTGDSRFNRLWTLLGTPCVTVPGLTTDAGLPIGIQVIAPFGGDDRALLAASFVEKALSSTERARW